MAEEIKIQDFGYSEMYEWNNIPELKEVFGRFVMFSEKNPETIDLCGNTKNFTIAGITTINSVIDSDDPDEWANKYLTTETGDIYLQNQRLVVGQKQYDSNLEMSFIKTYPWDHLVKIETDEYDPEKKYAKRSKRNEWIRVNLLGKAIVKDDGKCVPGKYCTPYIGKIKALWGAATPATSSSKYKFYVLKRLNKDTILVRNK